MPELKLFWQQYLLPFMSAYYDTFLNYIVTKHIALGSLPLPLHRQYNFQGKDHGKESIILLY